MAVMQQTLKPGNIFKIGQILDIANNYLETNIDFSYIKDYIPYAVEFSTENLATETIPGIKQIITRKSKATMVVFRSRRRRNRRTNTKNYFIQKKTTGEETENTTNSANSTNTTKKQYNQK